MGATTNFSLPYPANSDGPYGPSQIQALASALDSLLQIKGIGSATVLTQETTTSTSFTNLTTTGPAVTLTTGTRALVLWRAQASVGTSLGVALMGIAYGATAASDDHAWYSTSSNANDGYNALQGQLITGLTAGSNTFTAKYRTSTGTATFRRRHLIVIGLV